VVAAAGRARWAWMPCAASAVGRRQPRAEVGAPGGQPLAALGLNAASTSDSVEHSVYLGSRRALRPSASAGRCVPPALLQIPDTRGLRPAQLPRRQRPDHISRRGLGLACSAVRLLPCAAADAPAAISRRYRRARRHDITARPWASPWRGAASALTRQRMRRPRYRGDIAVSDDAISRRGLGLARGPVRLLP